MVIHFRAYRMEKQEWKPNNLQENEDAVAMSSPEFQLERQNFAERKAFSHSFQPILGKASLIGPIKREPLKHAN